MGDRLYFGSCTGVFHCVDRHDGSEIWTYDISRDGDQSSFHAEFLFANDVVVVGCDAPEGHVYAFEAETGSVRWKRYAGLGVYGDPARWRDRVVALTREDEIWSLWLTTGALAWGFAVPGGGQDDAIANRSSPLVAGTRVLFGAHDGHVRARHARLGVERWKTDLGSPVLSSSLLLDVACFTTEANEIVLVDPSNGDILARRAMDGRLDRPARLHRGTVLVHEDWGSSGGTLTALDPLLENVRWSRAAADTAHWMSARPHAWDELVLVGSSAGEVCALRVEDGTLAWWFGVDVTVRSIGRHDSTLYVGSTTGRLSAFELRALTEPAR